MKKLFLISWPVFLLLASCDKMNLDIPVNPEIKDYKKSDFSVIVYEKRCTKTFEFSIGEKGDVQGINNCETFITATAWNSLTIKISSKDKNFNGANVESSDPGQVQAERLTDSTYSLKYRSDGSAKISVHNPANKITFTVAAKEQIPIEGLMLRMGGKERLLPFQKRSYRDMEDIENHPQRIEEKIAVGKKRLDLTTEDGNWLPDTNWIKKGFLFEIVGIVPENTSWRNVSYYKAHGENPEFYELFYDKNAVDKYPYKKVQEVMCPDWNWFPESEKNAINDYIGTHKDISFIQGKKIWAYYLDFDLDLRIYHNTLHEVVITGNEELYVMKYYLDLEHLL